MTPLQRRLTAAAIMAFVTGLVVLLGQIIDGRAVSLIELLGVALGSGAFYFIIWPKIDRRWVERDRADDRKRFTVLAGALVLGLLAGALPRLTGTGVTGDFAVFIALAVAFVAAIVFDVLRHRPPVK